MISVEQFKIDREALAWRILQMMVQYRGLAWIRDRFMWEFRATDSMVQAALTWLLKRGYIERRGERWYLIQDKDTETEYLNELGKVDLKTGQSVYQFREEALTGMDRRGNQSELSRAALPSPSAPYVCNPEEIAILTQCQLVDLIRIIAEEAGLSAEEAAEGLRDGTVAKCRGTDGRAPHWAKFHKNTSSRHSRQYLCRECSKIVRRKRRQQRKDKVESATGIADGELRKDQK
jgi:hypothetical protein